MRRPWQSCWSHWENDGAKDRSQRWERPSNESDAMPINRSTHSLLQATLLQCNGDHLTSYRPPRRRKKNVQRNNQTKCCLIGNNLPFVCTIALYEQRQWQRQPQQKSTEIIFRFANANNSEAKRKQKQTKATQWKYGWFSRFSTCSSPNKPNGIIGFIAPAIGWSVGWKGRFRNLLEFFSNFLLFFFL